MDTMSNYLPEESRSHLSVSLIETLLHTSVIVFTLLNYFAHSPTVDLD